MDPEEKKTEQDELNPELKKALSDELSSYMNPHSTPVVPEQKVIPEAPKENISLPQKADAIPQQIEILEKPKAVIRTYKSDMEETIQTNHVSSINIALAENKKMMERMRSAEVEKVSKKKNYAILIISIILVVGGFLAFAIPYFFINKQFNPPKIVEDIPSGEIIATEAEEKINLESIILNKISSILSQRSKQSNLKLGSIKNIFLTEGSDTQEKVIDSNKFVSLLGFHLPSEISRTLRPEYMFGVHSFNGNREFLILRVGSYENAFSGMLKWEIDLWSDFKDIFSLKSSDLNGYDESNKMGIERATFQDATYANKDARIVKSASGEILFLYSIIDKNTILFTTSVGTLKEIVNRNVKSKASSQ